MPAPGDTGSEADAVGNMDATGLYGGLPTG
jgi:hypothetical protein